MSFARLIFASCYGHLWCFLLLTWTAATFRKQMLTIFSTILG
jgi:hypothetical protein